MHSMMPRFRRLALASFFALVLAGCGDLVRPICVETGRVEVTDDEVTESGFSVSDLLAWAGGEHTATGTYEDDSAAGVTVGLARGDGTAEVVTTEEGQKRTPGGGGLFGDAHLDIQVMCPGPTLTFPVSLSVKTDDGLVDLAVDASVEATDPEYLGASADIPADEMTGLPLPEGTISDGPCESDDPDEAFVSANLGSDAALAGSAGWRGEVECSDDSTAAWARYTLEWDYAPT